MRVPFLKQRETGNTWGNFMQVVQQLGLAVQVVNLVLLVITTSSILQTRGYDIPVWLLGIIAMLVIFGAGILVFTLGMPSYFSAFNEQFYKHKNPMRKDIEKIMEKLGIEREKNGD